MKRKMMMAKSVFQLYIETLKVVKPQLGVFVWNRTLVNVLSFMNDKHAVERKLAFTQNLFQFFPCLRLCWIHVWDLHANWLLPIEQRVMWDLKVRPSFHEHNVVKAAENWGCWKVEAEEGYDCCWCPRNITIGTR